MLYLVLNKFTIILAMLISACGASFGQSGRVATYSENVSPHDIKSGRDIVPPAETRGNNVKNQIVKDDDVIKIETDLVIVPAQTNERRGKPVAGIERREFKIFEDGAEQEIAYFSAEEQSFTVALVLDMSYSSVFKLSEIQAALCLMSHQSVRAQEETMTNSEVISLVKAGLNKTIIVNKIRTSQTKFDLSTRKAAV